MPGRSRTQNGEPEKPDWREQTVSLPIGAVLVFIGTIAGTALTTGALRVGGPSASADETAEVQKLHDEVVDLRADVKAMTSLLVEVKQIEEQAHPRVGVPTPPKEGER